MNSAIGSMRSSPVGPGVERRSAWWLPSRSWAPSLFVAVVAMVVVAIARTSLVDDAYITLSYARNLAFDGHWGLVPTATANTATSVLYVWVLAGFTAITRQPVLAMGIVYVLSALAVEYGLRRVARRTGLPAWFALLAATLIVVNPLLISSIGLETALGAGLIALLLASAVEDRPVVFGLLGGLLVLARPDLAIVALVVFLVCHNWRRRWWWAPVAAIGITFPWYLWSWFALGSAVPITFFIKTENSTWSGFGNVYGFHNGLDLYFRVFPTATSLSVLPAVLGVLAALIWVVLRVFRPTDRVRQLDRVAPLALAGVLHYVAYSFLGVAPYHWYYGPSIICTTMFLAAAVAAAATPAQRSTVALRPRSGPLAVVVLLAVACLGYYGSRELPSRFAPIQTNWAAPEQYAQIGSTVRAIAGDRVVASTGEVGAQAYFCDCAMADLFSNPAAVAGLLPSVMAKSGPIRRKLLDVNFHHFDWAPPGMKPELVLQFLKTPPANAIAVWIVDSPWTPGPGPGPNYIALVPTP
ncbi:4-amino-4-deoxy-L-arabinose transferase [Kibdelosporangium sp. 4NS15]|uniref:4-amino-4-deoxy-L-arabinose transferase n=1 Tax=Kibdelosporangium persicum TaxID=2698649 RepID=A0ABX2FJ44_9PSEU|nr:4-amino-4-deoxy-L-arabinose transferase [Kibdelosporangium persicum]